MKALIYFAIIVIIGLLIAVPIFGVVQVDKATGNYTVDSYGSKKVTKKKKEKPKEKPITKPPGNQPIFECPCDS